VPTLFVLDVPEFRPLPDALRGKPGVTVAGPAGGYFRISAETELRIDREETGLGEAVWFGAPTGGYSGGVLSIDDRTLVIRGETGSP
jgi:hypothetical protein